MSVNRILVVAEFLQRGHCLQYIFVEALPIACMGFHIESVVHHLGVGAAGDIDGGLAQRLTLGLAVPHSKVEINGFNTGFLWISKQVVGGFPDCAQCR